MKVLIASPFFPYPTDSGGKTRLRCLIQHLAGEHELTLVAFIGEEEMALRERLGQSCRFEPVPVRVGARAGAKLASGEYWRDSALRASAVLGGVPPSLARFLSRRFADVLRRLESERRFDVVHLEYVQMGVYSRFVDPSQRWIVSAVEIASVRAAREAGASGSASDGGSKRIAVYERSLFARADGVIAMSEADAATISASCPEASVFVVPNGVDDALLGVEHRAPLEPLLLFVGGIAHWPNLDGVEYFLQGGAWDALTRAHPGIRLRLVGRGWREVGAVSADPRVEIEDYVEDLGGCYGSSSLLIAPIRVGSGTRLKILEAMAAGLPVVSTTVGCEGLGASDGRELSIADGAEDFARAVTRLIEEPEAARAQAERARAHVRERFLWSRSAEALGAAYDEVVRSKGGGRRC